MTITSYTEPRVQVKFPQEIQVTQESALPRKQLRLALSKLTNRQTHNTANRVSLNSGSLTPTVDELNSRWFIRGCLLLFGSDRRTIRRRFSGIVAQWSLMIPMPCTIAHLNVAVPLLLFL